MTATKQTELLPCPFCGGNTNARSESQHTPDCYFTLMASFRVAAEKNADLSLAPAVTKAWNRRAQSAEPVQGEAAGRFCGEFGGDVNGNMWFKVRTPGAIPAPGAMLYTSPAKPDAELVELLRDAATQIRGYNDRSPVLKRIDAKLAELQGGNHASTPV